jgi:hypothetical protein
MIFAYLAAPGTVMKNCMNLYNVDPLLDQDRFQRIAYFADARASTSSIHLNKCSLIGS